MVITKKSPLSILRHLRVVNLEFLKQRFDGCLFQVSFYVCMYVYICVYICTRVSQLVDSYEGTISGRVT